MYNIETENMSNVPIIHGMCRIARIMETVNEMVAWDEDRAKISPWFLIESLVITILCNRRPLWKMHEFWTRSNLDFFIKN